MACGRAARQWPTESEAAHVISSVERAVELAPDFGPEQDALDVVSDMRIDQFPVPGHVDEETGLRNSSAYVNASVPAQLDRAGDVHDEHSIRRPGEGQRCVVQVDVA